MIQYDDDDMVSIDTSFYVQSLDLIFSIDILSIEYTFHNNIEITLYYYNKR